MEENFPAAVKPTPVASAASVPVPGTVKQNWRGLLNQWQNKNTRRAPQTATFELVNEVGPAHQKKFTYKCSLMLDGEERSCSAEAPSKKKAMAMAAELVYLQVLKMEPPQSSQSRANAVAAPSGAVATTQPAAQPAVSSVPPTQNFVGELHQFAISTSKGPPTWKLVSAAGPPRHSFCMEVSIVLNGQELKGVGTASKKKVAKQFAARELLSRIPPEIRNTWKQRKRGNRKRPYHNNGRNTGAKRVKSGVGWSAPPPAANGGNIGASQALAIRAEEAYSKYTEAASKGMPTADELYTEYRKIYGQYAEEYTKSFQAANANNNKAQNEIPAPS